MSYEHYMHQVLSRDPWFTGHATSIKATSESLRLDRILNDLRGGGVPVMVLTSKDDFILTPENIRDFAEEAGRAPSDQVVHQFDHGGHMGFLFNPRIRRVVGDFARVH